MDPMTIAALISGGTNLAGSLFGGKGKYTGASPEDHLQQASQMGRETFDPYIKRGFGAQEQASGQYGKMAGNPMDFLNQIISGYKPSEGYKFKEKHALNAARNSAAAGGISGTYNDQLGQSELVNGLLDQDMQQWLQNVLGIQGAGLGGLENEAGRGFGASQSLAELLGNISGSRAGLAYNRQQGSQEDAGNIFGQLGGLLGTAGDAAGNSDWFKKLREADGSVGSSPSGGGTPFKFATNSYGGFR